MSKEIWVHKYKYSHETKRRKFRKLKRDGKVIQITNPEYNLSKHYVYKYIKE